MQEEFITLPQEEIKEKRYLRITKIEKFFWRYYAATAGKVKKMIFYNIMIKDNFHL